MKICMSIPQLYSPREGVVVGGNTNAMLALSEGLVNLGHSLMLLSGWAYPNSSDEVRAKLSYIQLELLRLRTTGPMFRNIEFMGRLLGLAYKWRNANQFEILHSHSGYVHLTVLTVLLKRILGLPAVHTLYCPVTDRFHDKRRLYLKVGKVIRSCLLQMDCIIAISENIRKSLVRLGVPEEKVVVIRPAIRQCRIVAPNERDALRRELGMAPGQLMILFVGNFMRAKGLDLVVRAFAKVKRRLSQTKLVFAVERGPKLSEKRESEIRTLVRSLTDPTDTIELGIVSDMPLLMASSDLFVLPFRETNGPMDYPMALLEAMAAGRAVVTTRVGGLLEVVRDGETGMLVDAGDAEALSQAMLTILTKESLRLSIASRAKSEVLETFSPERIARETEEIYKCVLKARNGGRG